MILSTTTRGRTQVRYTGLALPELSNSMTAATALAFQRLIVFWYNKFGPEHFRSGAYTRYGGREANVYEPRAYKGSGAKARSAQAPLVAPYRHRDYTGAMTYPGALRRAFLNGGMRTQVQGRGVKDLKIVGTWPNLPRYTYIDQHGKSRAQGPKKYLELTITSEAEAQEMEQMLRVFIDEELTKMSQGQSAPAMAA